jgi:adenylylsulfate kinase-like enzyme
VLWFTGLPGSGKSTLTCAQQHGLAVDGLGAAVPDGDVLRLNLCRNLSFTEGDR